ncbi:hypothetical protein F3Y22_tig00110584pilonHSYRG00056 [Hibiscus syriacus]|uniref:Malectin-like domain-containing protein n=1 Tax=Hibiscus syriacus TaxID=106335 RepID=A0A6A3A7U6_HIBSY|nr:hypothetical protein F3Y22_tig00110584pilonHSYRG00056 [Hibiscus syriacus]
MPSMFTMLFFYSFLLLTHNSPVALSVELASPYEPKDIRILDCSSSVLQPLRDMDNIGSLHVPITNFSVVSKVYSKEPNYGQENLQPCIHKKPFTYTFPVYPGPIFIRLHFDPFSYSGFHISKALFSVTATRFTLLKTSAASYSEYRPHDPFSYTVKEFCVEVDGQVLNVTFTPSPDVSDAYAFVNKIEVVSMPSNLYIREVVSLPLIGQPSPYYIMNLTALEMMYRLNVGGDLIPEQEDTGMFRQWIPDVSFFTTDEIKPGIINSDVRLKQSSAMPAYVAPEQVYASARTVASDASNQNGTTWLLPIDSGFYYLVRLHFCEISNEIKGVGQRVFHVYIKDQIAEDQADIFLWANGAGVPVYRDYIVDFSEHTKRRTNLSVSIQNSNGSIKTSEDSDLKRVRNFEVVRFQQQSCRIIFIWNGEVLSLKSMDKRWSNL